MDTYYFNKNRYFPESHFNFPGILEQFKQFANKKKSYLVQLQQNIIGVYKKHIPAKMRENIRIAFRIFRIALIALIINV